MGIEYVARVAEMNTVVALTNHCYWALSGLQEGTIDNHILQIHSDEFVPADIKTYIPLGGLAPVTVPTLMGASNHSSTSTEESNDDKPGPFDFRIPSRVGDKIKEVSVRDPNKGFNVSFVVRGWKAPHKVLSNSPVEDTKHDIAKAAAGAVLRAHMDVDTERAALVHPMSSIERLLPAGTLIDPNSSRRLDIATTNPCIHLYTTFAWDAKYNCEGVSMKPGSALALECQFPADAANRSFGPIPRCTLAPNEEYRHLILHKFSW